MKIKLTESQYNRLIIERKAASLYYGRTYEDADRFLGPKSERKISPNTVLSRDGEDIIVTLYSTDIVRYKKNGSIVLDSGGHKTNTTANRINDCIHGSVGSSKGIWYVRTNTDRGEFYDGVQIKSNGDIF